MSDRAEALHAELVERVGSLRGSAEWLAAMTAAARLHDYSFGNWLLLWSQADRRGTTVSRPAGFSTWRRLGRHVRRGEQGYRILAPVLRRVDDGDESRRVVAGFRVATVFDVAQTDGAPLPDAGPRRLTGDDPTELFAAAVGMIEGRRFAFTLGRLDGPNGGTWPAARRVVVDERLEPAQRTKTTVHELAHVVLHAEAAASVDCRDRLEVEAESVAFVTCGAAGLDTSAYSVAYVAGWADAAPDPARLLLATAESVVRTSRQILASLDQTTACPNEPVHSFVEQCKLSADDVVMIRNTAVPGGMEGRVSCT